MNIQAGLLPIRGALFLAAIGAVALTGGCMPGLGFEDPEPQPPASNLCESNAGCTATPETPVCDETFSCRGCQDHGECASRVCNRDTGACVPESAVVYVAEDGTGDCSRASPCGSIAAALDLVHADNDARRAIRLDDGTYTESVALSELRVRIIGDGATIQMGPTGIPAPDPTRGAAVVAIGERAQVHLEGLRLQGTRSSADAAGIHCFGGALSSLWLLQVTVAESGGPGILAEDCILTVERSAITSNAGGGLLVIDSSFDVTNSYFLDNGDVASSDVSGVAIRNEAPVSPQRFAFNTVAGNQAGPGADASGVSCAVSPSSYMMASSNIVLVGLGGRRSVAGECPWIYSNLQGMSAVNPSAFAYQKNVDRDCRLRARADGLPSITAGTACDGRAQADFGILVDYDGESRIAATPDIGADEL